MKDGLKNILAQIAQNPTNQNLINRYIFLVKDHAGSLQEVLHILELARVLCTGNPYLGLRLLQEVNQAVRDHEDIEWKRLSIDTLQLMITIFKNLKRTDKVELLKEELSQVALSIGKSPEQLGNSQIKDEEVVVQRGAELSKTSYLERDNQGLDFDKMVVSIFRNEASVVVDLNSDDGEIVNTLEPSNSSLSLEPSHVFEVLSGERYQDSSAAGDEGEGEEGTGISKVVEKETSGSARIEYSQSILEKEDSQEMESFAETIISKEVLSLEMDSDQTIHEADSIEVVDKSREDLSLFQEVRQTASELSTAGEQSDQSTLPWVDIRAFFLGEKGEYAVASEQSLEDRLRDLIFSLELTLPSLVLDSLVKDLKNLEVWKSKNHYWNVLLWENLGVRGVFKLLEFAGLIEWAEQFLLDALDTLLKDEQSRRAQYLCYSVLEYKCETEWAEIVWKRLPLIWRSLGVEVGSWSPHEESEKLLKLIATRRLPVNGVA